MAGAGRDRQQVVEPAEGGRVEVDVLVARYEGETGVGRGAVPVFAGEKTGGERTVADEGEAEAPGDCAQRFVEVAHREVVVVLHRAERGEAQRGLPLQQAFKRGRGDIAEAEVTHATFVDEPVEGDQHRVGLGGGVPPMQIQHVQRVDPEALPGRLDPGAQGFRRVGRQQLGGDDQRAVHGPPGREPAADEALGGATAIRRGGVEAAHAAGVSVVHQGEGGGLVDLAAERDAAQANAAEVRRKRGHLRRSHAVESSRWKGERPGLRPGVFHSSPFNDGGPAPPLRAWTVPPGT